MALRQIPFLVGLRQMVKRDVSPQMLISLYAIRTYPGSSFSDVADKIDQETPNTYKSIRRLIERQLVEDRRIVTNPKTPGDLHVTPAGAEFLANVLEGNDAR